MESKRVMRLYDCFIAIAGRIVEIDLSLRLFNIRSHAIHSWDVPPNISCEAAVFHLFLFFSRKNEKAQLNKFYVLVNFVHQIWSRFRRLESLNTKVQFQAKSPQKTGVQGAENWDTRQVRIEDQSLYWFSQSSHQKNILSIRNSEG